MTQLELDRLASLQKLVAEGLILTIDQQAELLRLRTKLARTEVEVADNPDTKLVDETRSPNLSDDKDYRQEQIKRDVVETAADVKSGFSLLVWLLDLFRSFRG